MTKFSLHTMDTVTCFLFHQTWTDFSSATYTSERTLQTRTQRSLQIEWQELSPDVEWQRKKKKRKKEKERKKGKK